MGGCRCSFRDCAVYTARNPRMHFFKFPVSDLKRFEMWIKFSDANEIRSLHRSQQLNRVVCGRHFRDESFMNYKKDRLCPNQIPTITRISESLALDYEDLEEDGCTPKLIKLEKPSQRHLIPPDGFECPLGLDDCDDDIYSALQFSQPIIKHKTTKKRLTTTENNRNSKRLKLKDGRLSAKTMVVSKTSESTMIELTGIDVQPEMLLSNNENNLIEVASTNMNESRSPNKTPLDFISSVNVDCNKDLAFDKREPNISSLKNLLENPTVAKVKAETLCTKPSANICDVNNSTESQNPKEGGCTRNSEFSKTINQSKINLENLEEHNKRLKRNYDELADKHKKLQSSHDELTAKCFDLERQLKAKTTETSSASKDTQQPLTKAQLFNGIKRYLCSSMTTLVRMEMFGRPERQWKEDEKEVSVDLLRLGENVYNYFTDEWRFRMPSLQDAKNWMNNSISAINDEHENL